MTNETDPEEEILANPKCGYSWGFQRGDRKGPGHTARNFARPESTLNEPK